MYGKTCEYVGPAHGFAGIVAALGSRASVRRVAAGLAAIADRDGDLANWTPVVDEPLADGNGVIRTQWCHGSPGVVASVAGLPRDDELDSLLVAGGELTWAAGPLRKGANLCHGTGGNGYALLKLFRRTQDSRWLERARAFAMHAIGQVERRTRESGPHHSLWTGDLGAALYLWSCLRADDGFPTLDYF